MSDATPHSPPPGAAVPVRTPSRVPDGHRWTKDRVLAIALAMFGASGLLDEAASAEIERWRRYPHGMTLTFVDLDNFKMAPLCSEVYPDEREEE